MHYDHVVPGRFLSRPNRFIAHVELPGGEAAVAHVKNTGRCRELLVSGCTVYLQKVDTPARKTLYDLIAVEKSGPDGGRPRLINMDAQAPNRVFREWAEAGQFLPGLTLLRPETTWGRSRFDFYFEQGPTRPGFVEVKGVTLEEDGAVYFPDAPTQRGVKHVEELMACRAAGYEAYLFFVVQMAGVDHFAPNERTHPAFADALRRAEKAGVHILARECAVTPDSLALSAPVRLELGAARELE